jgi:hypothetical protein
MTIADYVAIGVLIVLMLLALANAVPLNGERRKCSHSISVRSAAPI